MRKLAKRARFEILQKITSNVPRVVWAEESKLVSDLKSDLHSYDDVPATSQFLTDGQSSCKVFIYEF